MSIYAIILICSIISFFMIYIYIYKNEKVYNFINKKIETTNKIILFAVEFLTWLLNIFIFLNVVTKYTYNKEYPLFLGVVLSVLVSLFANYFIFLFKRFKSDVASIFVVCMIPIGLTMMYLMLPDFIPDEQAHFQRAYAISCFDFSSSIHVSIDADYGVLKHQDYSQVLSDIYFESFQNETAMFHEACSYDMILYLFPAMSMFVGRMIGLSLYGCYYLGRMVNLALSIFFAYQTLRITPKAKWIFFILYFNPMMIHLSGSFSSDVMVNNICFFSVGYFLYLFNKEDPISNKDIVIVISCIMYIFIAKYVYLTVFGIYFLVLNKVLQISNKQWFLLVGCLTVWLFYYSFMKFMIPVNLESNYAQSVYLDTNNVDSKKQIDFLLSNPLNLINMYIHTFKEKLAAYVGTFVSRLGWLQIRVNSISFIMFYILAFGSAFLEDFKIKFTQRAWIMFVGIALSLLIILGLYLNWTSVGSLVTEGVQGRYFIPCALLILLAISNGKLSKIKNINYIYPLCAIVLNVLALKDVFVFFL